MDAVILLNKPSGMTSFDAVARCRRIFHEKRAGHTGTLDPEASGLMIILLGRYTKLLPFCVKDRKSYHAGFSFGVRTDTEDIWGTVKDRKEPAVHSDEEIRKAVTAMTGEIMQVPPMYSAIKKNGRKLYEYARKGIEVEREARPVTVYSLSWNREAENEYTLDASVSSGTYIRTLITDLGNLLGEYAVMTSLVRNGIDHLRLEDAAEFEDLESGKGMIDPLSVISDEYERVESDQEKLIRNGVPLILEDHSDRVVLTCSGKLMAVYEKRTDGLYHCVRGLF